MAQIADDMMLCASWLERRVWQELSRWPWLLTVLGDDNATRECKLDIIMRWWTAHLDDLDKYFARRLREMDLVSEPKDFLDDPQWAAFWKKWSGEVDLTEAQTEFRHTRYQRHNPSKNVSVHRFTAASFNSEAIVAHQEQAEQNRQAEDRRGPRFAHGPPRPHGDILAPIPAQMRERGSYGMLVLDYKVLLGCCWAVAGSRQWFHSVLCGSGGLLIA